ncbi:MAG TPA: phosphatase PAP2 family protein, partial [Acidimicrobiales bacterium]|nr:phosphatase PAP2 family protein [Acidimicrobiales bacterium]
EFWNLFYGTFHFGVTIFALVFLFRRFPARYRRWRNTLAATTALALIGFATYPLMPPRLLPASYGYVDTLRTYGSLWSFDSGAMSKISNQYAAMPSLHFAWAMWSTLVLVPALRSWWAKAAAALYPAFTLFAIVVTANHFVLDAVGGVVALGVGAVIGFALGARLERRTADRQRQSPDRQSPDRQSGDGRSGDGRSGDGRSADPPEGPPVTSAVAG